METSRRAVEVEEGITLGQFLKYAGAVGTGGHAKALIEQGEVTVNGDVEQRRGRKLRHGDDVRVGDRSLTVVRRGTDPARGEAAGE